MKFLDSVDRQFGRISEDRFYFILLAILAAIVAGIISLFVIGLQRNFLLIACDTAEFQNAIVNTLDGQWFRDSAYDGPSVLGLHSVLILALIAPVYAMFPSPNTLFLLQVWGIYSLVIPLYLIAVDMTQRRYLSFLIAAAMLASPMLLNMAMAPYHPESWIGAAVLWSYYFYRRDRRRAYWIAFAIAVCSGELAGPIYIALGLSLLLFEDGVAWRKRYGKYALLGGIAWMIFAVGILAPLNHVPGQQNLIANHYSQWKIDSGGQLILAWLLDPEQTLGTLFNPDRWGHLFAEFVGVPVALAFYSRRSLILLLPLALIFLMNNQEFYLVFHAYYFQAALIAGCLGQILFFARWDLSTRLGGTVMALMFFVNVLTLGVELARYHVFTSWEDNAFSTELRREFATLPPDAAVFGPHRYSVYLSQRDDMVMGDLHDPGFDFNTWVESRYPLTHVHASSIGYIVCDLKNDQCGWRELDYDPTLTQRRTDNVKKLIGSGEWKVIWSQNGVVILRRTGAGTHPS